MGRRRHKTQTPKLKNTEKSINYTNFEPFPFSHLDLDPKKQYLKPFLQVSSFDKTIHSNPILYGFRGVSELLNPFFVKNRKNCQLWTLPTLSFGLKSKKAIPQTILTDL
jgi:hypothetical protein